MSLKRIMQLSRTNPRTTFPFGLTFNYYQEEACTCDMLDKQLDKYLIPLACVFDVILSEGET